MTCGASVLAEVGQGRSGASLEIPTSLAKRSAKIERETPATAASDSTDRRKVTAAMPVRRMGSVEDIGHAALFSMTNPQVTGTVLEVSGGETLVDSI